MFINFIQTLSIDIFTKYHIHHLCLHDNSLTDLLLKLFAESMFASSNFLPSTSYKYKLLNPKPNKPMIKFLLMVNKQGQTRLAKYYNEMTVN